MTLPFAAIGFVFYFLINLAIAAIGNKIASRSALVASVSSPLALWAYLVVDAAKDHGLEATLADPKLTWMIWDAVLPFTACAAVAAIFAQSIVRRWQNRAKPA